MLSYIYIMTQFKMQWYIGENKLKKWANLFINTLNFEKKEEEDVGSFIYQTCRVHVYSLPFN